MMQTTAKWQPTASQARFHDALRQLGCVITGAKHGTQLHHVVGSSARYDKIWIGQWWVLILRADLHDSKLEASYNVTDYKTEFEERFGNQKSVFMRQFHRLIGAIALGDIKFDYKDLPPNSVIEAIQSYAR
jgi:hypothetical protein